MESNSGARSLQLSNQMKTALMTDYGLNNQEIQRMIYVYKASN